uniref:Uncharacterized protein n=1 Tax=uncultured Caudovirales phage TaxID=2100421 RepID=A0A6J5L6W6_9CAUD|nr:hypothetical protein UFOVP114_27 [uncultured Caudovirales phage]
MLYIQIRNTGNKGWWYATSDGSGTRKLIHAAATAPADKDKLLTSVQKMAPENPELDFRVVSREGDRLTQVWP